jgi:hypothetical protein
MTCDEFVAAVDALSLGALSPDEEAEAVDHASACARCHDVYSATVRAADLLALAVPLRRAPASMRANVFAAIDRDLAGDPGPEAVVDNRRRSPADDPPSSASTGSPIPISTRRDAQISSAGRGWRGSALAGFRVPALAAAVLAVGIVGLAAWTFSLQRQLSSVKSDLSSARAAAAAARFAPASNEALVLLSSPDTITAQLNSADGASNAGGGVIWNPQQRRCVVVARQLPVLPPGEQYRIWFVEGGRRWDGGELVPAADGSAGAVVTMDRWQINEGYKVSIVVQPRNDDGTRKMVLSGDVKSSLQ